MLHKGIAVQIKWEDSNYCCKDMPDSVDHFKSPGLREAQRIGNHETTSENNSEETGSWS